MNGNLCFTVHGLPAPMGSKRIVRGRLIEMSRRVRPWQAAVTATASAALGDRSGFAGPVSVEATFTLPRPASHIGTGRNAGTLRASAPAWPAVTPDLDKLCRATLDALTRAAVWADDARVVELIAMKVYPGWGVDALDRPGAVLRISPLQPLAGGAA